MKYAAYGLLVAFLAHGAYAAVPDSASGWYIPESGFSVEGRHATVLAPDGSGDAIDIYVDADGKITATAPSSSNVDDILNDVAIDAVRALVLAQNNKESIERMGEILYDFTSKTGIHIVNPVTGQDYTIRFAGGSLGNNSDSTIEGTSDAKNPTDNLSIGLNDAGKIEIEGWQDEGSGTMNPLAEALTKEHKNALDNYELVVRNGSHGLNYVQLGTLKTGGAPVDDCSITTNTANGAELQGYASLYGWRGANDETLARKGADGYLEWIGPEELLDGLSLSTTDVNGKNAIEIKDTHRYAGKHAKHYFGTGADKGGSLGWHELPNVTTNVVTGDGATIASNPNIPNMTPEEGVKYLGLRGWNYNAASDPLFLVNKGGVLDYLPLPAMTNANCSCTNKWSALYDWIENCEDGEGGIALPDDTLDTYLFRTLGYIYSTVPGNLHFDNSGSNITASFGAPENWADDISLDTNNNGEYQIQGFANAEPCNATIVDMLNDNAAVDANAHLFLAKNLDTGTLHYVPIGTGTLIGCGGNADGVTITTNATQGAEAQGLFSLFGWSNAQDGTVPMKKNNGIVWEDAGMPPDDVTLAVVTDESGSQQTKKLAIKGFSGAPNNSIPWKNEEGEFVWGGSSSITNRILAGAGINITDNGGGAVTISTQSFDSSGTNNSQTIVLPVITDIRYDEVTHKFQCKRRTITFKGLVSAVPQEGNEWEDIFEAVSHNSEHEHEEDN